MSCEQPEQLRRLIYISTASTSIDLDAIEMLLNQSSAKNRALGITGAMVFDGRYFMQCLEGRCADVTALFEKIECDTRHHSVELIVHETIGVPSFDDWYLSITNSRVYMYLLEEIPTLPFDPYRVNPKKVLTILRKIVAIA